MNKVRLFDRLQDLRKPQHKEAINKPYDHINSLQFQILHARLERIEKKVFRLENAGEIE